MQDAAAPSGLTVAVVFGGESVEHEVSVITGQQVMAALGATSHRAVPVYITKSGRWCTGDVLRELANFQDLERLVATAEAASLSLDPTAPGLMVAPARRRGRWQGLLGGGDDGPATTPVDVVIPVTHGGGGENGALQGLLELAGLPYAGSGVAASALSMDKALAKAVMRSAGLQVVPDVVVSRPDWRAAPDELISGVEERFGYPVFVKPVNLGSSIAVGMASDRAELSTRLETAAAYDHRIMVEPAQRGIVEVNCAVLGSGSSARPSLCEQPVSAGMLSYGDKYAAGGKAKGMKGSRRIIPAPIGDELTGTVTRAAVAAFQALGAEGVARVDLFVDQERGAVHVNEVNTIPGSLAFYLWEPAGLGFPALLEELIGLALERHRSRSESATSIPSWLLSGQASAGLKTSSAARD